jgi:hypothetical protein
MGSLHTVVNRMQVKNVGRAVGMQLVRTLLGWKVTVASYLHTSGVQRV